MKVFLVVGNNSDSLKQVLEKGNEISVVSCADDLNAAFNRLIENDLDFDVLLLMDQGIGNCLESFAKSLSDFKELIENLLPDVRFKFITKEPQHSEIFTSVVSKNPHFELHFIDQLKIPVTLLQEICIDKSTHTYEDTVLLAEAGEPSKKSLWPGLKKYGKAIEKKETCSSLEADNENDIKQQPAHPRVCRVAAFTGHRGSGVSSTVSGIAFEASHQGIKTIIIDLDLLNRGINLYFSKFGEEADLNPDLALSLVKCMLKPDSYQQNTCVINDNLFVSTLAYSINQRDKMLELISSRRLLAMLAVLKSKFQLILLDLPLEYLSKYTDILLHVDTIGLCVNNSLYSVINTVRNITEYCENEDLLLFKSKTRAVLTRYSSTNKHQEKLTSPKAVSKLLEGVSDIFDDGLEFCGTVPYSDAFAIPAAGKRQLSSAGPDYKSCFTEILNSII